MRKFIVLAACCVVGCVCSSSALARPLVGYNNAYNDPLGVKGSNPTLLIVNAARYDDCSVPGTDVVKVLIGHIAPFRMYPCLNRTTTPHVAPIETFDVSYRDKYVGAELDIRSYDFLRGGRFPLTVRYHGTAIFRGVLHIQNTITPVRRIYQGTDGFVNICINHNLKVYSYHLRLYCTVGGNGTSVTTITRRR